MKTDLSGVEVLIDSHDLSLPNGTGIKSYGLNLIRALKELGANPELLVAAKSHSNALLARAMLYDEAARQERPVEKGRFRAHRCRLSLLTKTAKHLPANGAKSGIPIPDTVFPYGLGTSSFSNCYGITRSLLEKFGTVSVFRTAKDYRIWHATLPLQLRHKKAVQITTIHDLIPLLWPHLCQEIRHLFYQRVADAVTHSRVISVVSEHTKKDLQYHFSVPEEKIVIVNPVSHMSRRACDDREIGAVMKMFNLKRGRYILSVGTIESRKNVRRLIEAYLRLDCNFTLFLVGKMGYRSDAELEVVEHLKRKRGQDVRVIRYVPDSMIPALYQGASCFAFPSLSEGFGIPVLEAMIAGCPVICSSATSLPEVAGDAAHYIDPLSVESICAGLEKVLTDLPYRQTLIEKGLVRAGYFSPERFTQQVADLYGRALA